MVNIYVVTHPEATHHTTGLVGGWFDSDLTVRGRGHARDIAAELTERLAGRPIELRSSDLRRTAATAEIIGAALDVDVLLDPDLRERSFGVAGGRPQQWLQERTIPLPDTGDRLRHDDGIEGAETRWQLAERCYRAMDAVMGRVVAAPGTDHVVVTHGGAVTYLVAAWLGMPTESAGRMHLPVTSGSITRLRKDPRSSSHQLVELGSVQHLST